jgi:hypothetical protein
VAVLDGLPPMAAIVGCRSSSAWHPPLIALMTTLRARVTVVQVLIGAYYSLAPYLVVTRVIGGWWRE